MASKFIKNNTGSASTYVGQQINAGAYYEIQSGEMVSWQNNSTLLSAIGAGDAVVAKADDGSADLTDVNAGISYLKEQDTPTDSDGVPLQRKKMTAAGWHYQLYGIELTTGSVGSLSIRDSQGGDFNSHGTLKFYDSNDNELTLQAAVDTAGVKTVLEWEPPWDYEMIGGQFRQRGIPTSGVYLGVTAVPDIPAIYGGSVPFVNNINLAFAGTSEAVRADGRTSKRLAYDAVNHTNKLKFLLEHPAGLQHDIHLTLEIFRA